MSGHTLGVRNSPGELADSGGMETLDCPHADDSAAVDANGEASAATIGGGQPQTPSTRSIQVVRRLHSNVRPCATLRITEHPGRLGGRDAFAVLGLAPTPEDGSRLTRARIRAALARAERERNLDSTAEVLVMTYGGTWWMPDLPGHRVPGTLSWDGGEHPVLELHGQVSPLGAPTSPDGNAIHEYAAILGRTFDAVDITCYRCLDAGGQTVLGRGEAESERLGSAAIPMSGAFHAEQT